MNIFDASILDLPLYEERHRILAKRLEEWVASVWQLQEADAGLDPRERGKSYVRMLARDGWFEGVIGADSGKRPDLRSVCLMREAFAYLHDLVDFAFAIQCLGSSAIDWFGNAELKQTYISAVRSGELIGCLALSEPELGSNLSTAACQAKSEGNGFSVNGTKAWVSHGDIADFACVLARTGEGPGPLGLSLFAIPLPARREIAISPIDFVAPRACANMTFDACPQDRSTIIGEAGSGFRYAMAILDFYRVTVGSAAIGFSRRARNAALQWCKNRKIGNDKLLQMQLTQAKLANIDVQLHASALLVVRAAWEFDVGQSGGSSRNAAMAKLYATEAAQNIIDDSVQLLGAAGLTEQMVTSRLYREIRSLRIYEGTSEIQRMIIAGSTKLE
ncbi:MAG: acyl-CoA dehydrogenase family protein [Burkholderiales bacterium]|nr:acyl-CoA dehydrogenase family protein [Burkholderiales bacterium]